MKQILLYLRNSSQLFVRLIFFGYIIIIFAYSCSPEKQKVDNQQKQKIHQDSTYDEIVWKDYNRIISLLSIKNSIPESVVKPIILEYLRINSPVEYFKLTMNYSEKDTTVFDHVVKPIEGVNKTIQRLSEKYSIKPDTIGIILFDFEIWSKLLEIEDDVRDNHSITIPNEFLKENEN